VLIQIGQDIDEPTIERFARYLRRRVRIAHRPCLPNIREMLGLSSIEPCRCRRIFRPWMMWPSVVCDFILNDFDSQSMRCFDEFAQFCERAEMLFDAVKIDWAVTVIIRDRTFRAARLLGILLALVQVIDVVVPWCQPNRSHT